MSDARSRRHLLLAAAAMSLAGACGRGAENSPGGGGANPTGDLKLGVSTALTGSGAQFGVQEGKAVELLVEQLNAKGGIKGRKIKLKVNDNATDPQKSVLDVKEFVGESYDAVMVGPVQSVMKAIEDLASQILVVNFASGYVPPKDSTIFCPSPAESGPVETTFNWFRTKNISKFGLIAATDATGETAVKAVNDALGLEAGKGMQLVGTERFDPKAPDVSPQLTRLRDANPQAVISWVSGSPAGVVAKSFTQLGMSIPLVVSWANGSYAFAKSTASFSPQQLYVPVAKAMLPDAYGDDEYAKLGRDYVNAFKQKHNEVADAGAMFTFDPFTALVKALEAGTTLDIRKKALNELKFTGIFGRYQMTPTDHKGGAHAEGLAMVQVTGSTLKPAGK